MMQKPFAVIKAEQKRTYLFLSFVVAETSDDAIGAAIVLDLLHAVTLAGTVCHVAALGDDSIQRVSNASQPFYCIAKTA